MDVRTVLVSTGSSPHLPLVTASLNTGSCLTYSSDRLSTTGNSVYFSGPQRWGELGEDVMVTGQRKFKLSSPETMPVDSSTTCKVRGGGGGVG
jgi:hypothetical protein